MFALGVLVQCQSTKKIENLDVKPVATPVQVTPPPVEPALSNSCDGNKVNDLKEGPWVCKNSEGLKIAELNFHKGRKDGFVRLWNKNGNLDSESHWKEGRLIGKLKSYHSTGKLNLELSYDSEQRLNGRFREWDAEGHQIVEGHYISGFLNGRYREWDSRGLLVVNCTYKKGKPAKSCPEHTHLQNPVLPADGD
jgi:antitoxin component YwqK of YwqJK toxin-antitoxin module